MTTTYRPAEAFPPGDYLREELEARDWTVTEFAQILGRPIQAISEILNGRKEITPDTAIDLADALGTSAELWLNLQTTYRLHLAHQRPAGPSAVERRSRLRALAPVAEMQRRGWLTDTADLDQLETEVTALYGMSSITDTPSFAAAARRSNADGELTPIQMAWLARIRALAGRGTLPAFDPTGLADLAAALPRMLRDGPEGLVKVSGLFRLCGVAFVYEPALKGSKLDGAVIFTDGGIPALGVTARYDRFDGLLFTILHEAAHLTLGHVTATSGPLLDEGIEQTGDGSEIEQAANDQAAAWLFPTGFAPPPGRASVGAIAQLATHHDVHPSVVIGRLQRDGILDYSQLRNHLPKVKPHLEVATP